VFVTGIVTAACWPSPEEPKQSPPRDGAKDDEQVYPGEHPGHLPLYFREMEKNVRVLTSGKGSPQASTSTKGLPAQSSLAKQERKAWRWHDSLTSSGRRCDRLTTPFQWAAGFHPSLDFIQPCHSYGRCFS